MEEPGKGPLVGLLAILGVTVAALVAAAILDDDDLATKSGLNANRLAERIPRIAKRVEDVRGIRFKNPPEPEVVDLDRVRGELLEELKDPRIARELPAAEETLKVLGLLAPKDSLREAAGQTSRAVVGFYDDKEGRLSLVRGAEPADPLMVGLILAHELTHALEDQRFGLGEDKGAGLSDDAQQAARALAEGSANAVGMKYVDRYVGAERALGSAVGQALSGQAEILDIPGFVRVELGFRYEYGQRFVERLYSLARGWKLVNLAHRSHPPLSTEQIFHPRKYLLDERPVPVELRVAPVLGPGWKRVAGGSLGELDSIQLLLGGLSQPEAMAAAAGWGGGRYELWRRGPLPAESCPAPCRERDALILAWRWDTGVDAVQFGRGIRTYLAQGLGARRTGSNSWRFRGSRIALAQTGRASSMVFAPGRDLAARLAIEAEGGRD